MDPRLLSVIVIAIFGGVWWYMKRNPTTRAPSKSARSFTAFGHDLTADAEAGRLTPAISRDDEIDRVINIIRRRLKNNPLLIGEPGVGKTAIVEGLALRIANHQVPPEIKGSRVFALDLADMLAGTAFRGELEQRLRKFTDELEAAGDKTILFIDEIHMIHQVKGVEGGLNLSDMLKPALARGKIAVIGATTWGEYQSSLQKDPAIERRFQPVIVSEPSREVAIEILRHLKERYEKHHGVIIDDGAVVAAVDLSQQMIRDRYLPDKALDVIDEAAAKATFDGYLGHRAAEGAIGTATEDAIARIIKERGAVEGELEHLKALEQDYKNDAALESAERSLKEHAEALGRKEKELRTPGEKLTVTADDVRRVIERWKAYYDMTDKT